MEQLRSIKSPIVTDVRGKGLMIGMEVPSDKRNEMLKKLQEAHILAIPAGENVVRFLPPFLIEKEEIDKTINTLKKILIDSI